MLFSPDDLCVDEYIKITSKFVAPGLRGLQIINCHVVGVISSCIIEPWEIKYLLKHCESTLEYLSIGTGIGLDEMHKVLQEPESLPLLKCLVLYYIYRLSSSDVFLSWLWKRWSHVERLELSCLDPLPQCLVDNLPTHMPNLNIIHLNRLYMSDEKIAELLSKSRKGWKEVHMEDTYRNCMQSTHTVLMEHCPTLERLEIHSCYEFNSVRKAQILAASPNLHTFATLNSVYSSETSIFDAHSFIDQDPHTGALKTWACESSLKTLKVRIAGAPRLGSHGASERGVAQETYSGQGQEFQGREIQGLVYDRLARLTHLETLWLAPPRQYRMTDERDCLELSLESGLRKLAGLNELKELGIGPMRTRIGLQEIQWMVDHWPKLRTIIGLGKN
ncbi:hypothetical protein BGX34_005433, partial [Mortierella sp. NVP85]